LTLRSVDRRTDSSAITDFVISPKGDDLSAVEQIETSGGQIDFSLRHFTVNPGNGILTPATISQEIPVDSGFIPSTFAISTSTTTNLFAQDSPQPGETSQSDLLVYHADNATSGFGEPFVFDLGTYNSDSQEGTIAGGFLVSADGRNLFYEYRTRMVTFPSGGVVFTNRCGLGRFSINLGTNVPILQDGANFGDCVNDSSLLTQEGNNFYLKSGPKIVGASIAADGTLKVIGSATQPLLEFPQDPGGSFIASVTPK
jgi:hypothetical protein